MRKLGNALARLEFGALPPPPLVKKNANQAGLQQQHRGHEGDLPAIFLPR
jgi:hypothetical protein